MELDKIYIPKIKLTSFLERKVTEPIKKTHKQQHLPPIHSPFKSDTQRICILNWPRPGYMSKRTKAQFQSFRSKSFKSPTNACLEHVNQFEQKRNLKHLANQVQKLDLLKRELISVGTPLSNHLGLNQLKITNSLMIKQQQMTLRRISNTSDVNKNLPTSEEFQDRDFVLENGVNTGILSRKKYAQLTFKEIMEIESDEQERLRKPKLSRRRKVKTETSSINRT